MSDATQAVVLYTPKAFDRVYQAGFIQKLNPCELSGHDFWLISSFHSNSLFHILLMIA